MTGGGGMGDVSTAGMRFNCIPKNRLVTVCQAIPSVVSHK